MHSRERKTRIDFSRFFRRFRVNIWHYTVSLHCSFTCRTFDRLINQYSVSIDAKSTVLLLSPTEFFQGQLAALCLAANYRFVGVTTHARCWENT